MRDITKYQGIIPAFYACYEEDGSISTERTKALAEHLLKKGVKGVYVGVPPANVFTRARRNARQFWKL